MHSCFWCLLLTNYNRGDHWIHDVFWPPYGIIFDIPEHSALPDCGSRGIFRQVGDRQASHDRGCEQWLHDYHPTCPVCRRRRSTRMGYVQHPACLSSGGLTSIYRCWCHGLGGKLAKHVCRLLLIRCATQSIPTLQRPGSNKSALLHSQNEYLSWSRLITLAL